LLAAAPAVEAAPALKSGYFRTPSGNIQCDYVYPGRYTYVRCGINRGFKPPPPRRGPSCTPIDRIGLNPTGGVRIGESTCPGEDTLDSGPYAPPSRSQAVSAQPRDA
jgi:hypothetical protein